MSQLSLEAMRSYLVRSIGSLNLNKMNGTMAKVALRKYLAELGFCDRFSPGGWIARRQGAGEFGHVTVALFPEIVRPAVGYPAGREFTQPSHNLHTICSTFQESGIAAFYCAAIVACADDPDSLLWRSIQLGLPSEQQYRKFPDSLASYFGERTRPFDFLRHGANVGLISLDAIPEEFCKEHLRTIFSRQFFAELSAIDGILCGQRLTYIIEVIEQTAAPSSRLGEFFGLDLGPFVKLAFYAAKRGNLHSLFIVREIASVETRELKEWWFIPFERLAQFASWVPQGGGKNMLGGGSTVVCIPKAEFSPLNLQNLSGL